jgi:hypothetical protein
MPARCCHVTARLVSGLAARLGSAVSGDVGADALGTKNSAGAVRARSCVAAERGVQMG